MAAPKKAVASKADVHVHSTSTNDSAYVIFTPGKAGDPKAITKRIIIKGGANRAHRRTLITPKGITTRVSADDYALLQEDKNFQRHLAAGFLSVTAAKDRVDSEDAAADMESSDKSRQRVQTDAGMDKLASVGADEVNPDANPASSKK